MEIFPNIAFVSFYWAVLVHVAFAVHIHTDTIVCCQCVCYPVCLTAIEPRFFLYYNHIIRLMYVFQAPTTELIAKSLTHIFFLGILTRKFYHFH